MLKPLFRQLKQSFILWSSSIYEAAINVALTDLGVKQEHIHYEFSAQQQAYNKQKRGIYFTSFLFVLVINGLLFHDVYLSVDQFRFVLIFHI